MTKRKKGFVIIIVVAFLAALILVAWVIVNIGLSEILQTRTRNDLASAYYAARAGAEMMYLNLKSKGADPEGLTWAQLFQPISGSVQVPVEGSTAITVGNYSATAGLINGNDSDEFGIVSNGTVNGRTSRVTVKYYYSLDVQSAIPI